MAAHAVLGLIHGGVAYVPWGDDEFINWLRAAKQLYLARWDFLPHIQFSLPSYPQAWPTLLALPSIMLGRFSEDMASVLPFALHVAFLGVLFDFAGALSNRRTAWVLVLFGLTVEITWKLLPLNLMSEQPQIYAVAAVFVLCLWAELGKPCQRRSLLLAAGMVTAHAYLIKSAALLLVPALMVVVGWPLVVGWRQWRCRMGTVATEALLALGPFTVVWFAWSRLAGDGDHCATSLDNYLSASGVRHLLADTSALSAYVRASLEYYASYKVPLSVATGLGLAFGLAATVTRKVTVATLVYALLYHVVLFWSYQTCPDSFNFFLSSLQRYILVPLRVLHVLGLILLFHALLPRVPFPSRRFGTVLVAAAALLAAGQVWFLHRGLVEIRQRINGGEFAAIGQAIKASEEPLRRVVASWNGRPRVLQMARFAYAYPLYPTYHYLMNADGRTLPFAYCLATGEGEVVRLDALVPNDCVGTTLEQELAATDIVWPLSLSPPMIDKLRPWLDQGCPMDLSGQLLVRRGDAFTCGPP
ncbi:hypothetical protein [Magnetospirillum sulfuroxidans]|uniref:Glycosyltransferase RgtA/B/C/D-like domain-containing protein n=1 Tax=Magnetospirillum sulfuroxidans TaxID=611300 RepID=A0ABS5IEF3_9PROT|nr:hypothetical protein [Magnetospirillum sulfuroxidans]MBR9972780.1 hypothetical protein [Magnetospirillum sulfuroxidans]